MEAKKIKLLPKKVPIFDDIHDRDSVYKIVYIILHILKYFVILIGEIVYRFLKKVLILRLNFNILIHLQSWNCLSSRN